MLLASILRWAIPVLGMTTALLWLGRLRALVRHRKEAHWLADLPDNPPRGGWPRLAVLFAARDEAAGVERAARSIRHLALSFGWHAPRSGDTALVAALDGVASRRHNGGSRRPAGRPGPSGSAPLAGCQVPTAARVDTNRLEWR